MDWGGAQTGKFDWAKESASVDHPAGRGVGEGGGPKIKGPSRKPGGR